MTDGPSAPKSGAVERREFDGSRWINYRPSAEEVAAWFTESFAIDPKLRHEDYVGGIAMIPAVDTRAKYITGFTKTGVPIIEQREELSYNPYARVETRIKFWWDMLAAHPEWRGVVERITPPRMPIDFVHTEEDEQSGISESGQPQMRAVKRRIRTPGAMTLLTHQLPDGFSIMSAPVKDGYSHFLCCTIRVSIYDREDLVGGGKTLPIPLRTGVGTKQVPLLIGRDPYADPNSVMRAETGALGRALGFAGVFVLSGSGVATAEDMEEALAQGRTVAGPPPTETSPQTPTDSPVLTGAEQTAEEEQAMLARASELYRALAADRPEKAEEFGKWAKERKLTSLSDARGAVLRGVVKKLERLSEETPAEVTPDGPTEEAPDAGQ